MVGRGARLARKKEAIAPRLTTALLPSNKTLMVEWWPIARPKPYARNARKIPQKAIDKVALSLREFGWQQPIVCDSKDVIIAGHTRLLAAQQEKMTLVPVVVASHLTPAQVRAYRLMDNRSHQETDWDLDLLGSELGELKGLEFDLSLTGFDSRELDALLLEKNAEEDDVPPPPEVPVSRLGDLWLLGGHRVLCGDATSSEAVSRVCGEWKPLLMVTDPPYGVDYDPAWRAEAGVNQNRRKLGKVDNDDRADWREAWALFSGNVAYVWHAGRHASVVQQSLESSGFQIRNQIIWAKDRFALSRGHYHWQHEPCWYAVRGSGLWYGDRSQNTLWQVKAREDGGHGHGTQKPVELMRRPILNHTKAGDFVYDPFLGSGTTLIACEATQRRCAGMDIDPKYVDVIVQRWQNLTGKAATREGGGTFKEVLHERRQSSKKSAIGAVR